MRLEFYIKLLRKSLVGNKTMMIVLTLQFAISIMMISAIFTFLNGSYHTVKDQVEREKGIINILLAQPIPLGILAEYEMDWRETGEVKRLSYLATIDDQVKHNENTEVLPIFSVNQDYSLFFGFPFEGLNEGEVVLTVNAAKKLFPNRVSKSLVGEVIEIANKLYYVKAIEQRSLVERVYIPQSDFLLAYGGSKGVAVGNVIVDDSSKKAALEGLKDFSPMIIQEKSKYLSFISFLVLASLVTIILVIYSILNFVQLYGYKLMKEQDKWNILFLMGATRKNLRAYLYTEIVLLSLLALFLASFGCWKIIGLVSLEGISFKIDFVVIILILVMILIMIILSVELTLRKLRRNVFK